MFNKFFDILNETINESEELIQDVIDKIEKYIFELIDEKEFKNKREQKREAPYKCKKIQRKPKKLIKKDKISVRNKYREQIRKQLIKLKLNEINFINFIEFNKIKQNNYTTVI